MGTLHKQLNIHWDVLTISSIERYENKVNTNNLIETHVYLTHRHKYNEKENSGTHGILYLLDDYRLAFYNPN